MPELPEVETVCRGLAQHLPGRRINAVTLRRKDIRSPIPEGFALKIQGRKVTHISRRAKYILIHLDSGQVILLHLGMSGKVLIRPEMPAKPDKHDHMLVEMDDGSVMIFNDARRFGQIDLTTEKGLASHPQLKNLGLEPLSEEFDAKALEAITTGKKVHIKPLLMDQARLVGVGNIYASEALFRSHIKPTRPAGSLKPAEIKRLATAIPQVLQDAIASGGSTLRDFVRSSGDGGYFQHHFAVYGRAGKPCQACGTPIEQMVQAGRSSFFCPKCQK